MKPIVYFLLLLYIGFVAYSVALFTAGEAGLGHYENKVAYRNALLENINELNSRKTTLNAELRTLRRSSEQNRVFARKLGYYESTEYKVNTPFRSSTEEPLYIGRILSFGKVDSSISNLHIALTISIILCITCLIAVLLKQRSR